MEIINLSGQRLELSEDVQITVERYNSLFNDPDKTIQDQIYPAKTGLTDRNKIFIGSGHLLEAENDKYSLPVQVIISGTNFFSGIFIYKIINLEINFELRVNLGSIANKMKEVSIRDIYTTDSYFSNEGTNAFPNLMKDTCENPLKYPYVFFPVYNDRWIDGSIPDNRKFINQWDHTSQKFLAPSVYVGETLCVPYWRLSYLIYKILQYLKFNITGNYFSDPDEQEIYLYSLTSLYYGGILPSTSHLPDLKINEFFKQIIERRRISFNVDVFNNTINVVTAQSVLDDPDYIDISDYVESIQEISVSEQKGYQVTLGINEDDPAWDTGTDDKPLFQYPYILKVGSGENKIRMSAGTLRSKKDANYSYPMNFQRVNYNGNKITPTWPVSLLRYKGMKNLPDGKVFPEANPLDLEDKDGKWLQFLNDSKQGVIIANIPPTVLARMQPTTKLGFISNQGAFFKILPEQISFNLSTGITELIKGVKIEGRVFQTDYKTKISIETLETEQVKIENHVTNYKAFWDPELHAISSVKMERVPIGNSQATFGYTIVKDPTDDYGVGGAIGSTFAKSGSRIDIENSELRVYSDIQPRYFIRLGIKGNFIQMPGYWKFPSLALTGITAYDGDKPIWIVF